MRVSLFTRSNCNECDEVRRMLNGLAGRYGLEVREVEYSPDDAEAANRAGGPFQIELAALPIVRVDDIQVGQLTRPITEYELHAYLQMAHRARELSTTGVVPKETALDRLSNYLAKRWLRIAAIGVGIFVALPWLAPIFAALGWWNLADPLYTAYALQCHQLPERSAIVFGYEVAQCWRCNALYGGMVLFAIAYAAARDRDVPALRWLRKPLPLWAFALLLLPMLADGLSHMFGLRATFDPEVEPAFGSFLVGAQVFSLNWVLRILTGFLAAGAFIWFSLPRMQRAIDEAEALRAIYRQGRVRATPLAGSSNR